MKVADCNLDCRTDTHSNSRKKNQNLSARPMKRFADVQLEDLLSRDYPECV